MNEYILIFRYTPNKNFKPTPKEENTNKQAWGEWVGEIASQVKFVSINRIGFEGIIINPDLESTPGFYQDSNTKEMVSGNMIIKSDSLEEASELAKGCPILSLGGSVEVRSLIPMAN